MPDPFEFLQAALGERYRIVRELGHGGTATVYLAHDASHAREVAIKVLRAEIAMFFGAERFLREIRIAAQLQSPHILTLIDSGEAGGFLFYVMPYVEGESLRNRLARDGALPASEATRILRDVVDGLAHAHRHGVVHRDVKPDNVMLSERHALVVDFGVAKAMSDAAGQHDLTSIGISVGTPAYMSPEQAAADPHIDHRADIYAAGVLAYEMLAGHAPFTGTPQAILMAQISVAPVPLPQAVPSCPAALAAIVMKCLEKDPARRYQTADELLSALEALATPDAGTASALALRKSTGRAIAGVAVLALLAIAGVWYFLSAKEKKERWMRTVAIPEIERQLAKDDVDSDSAFILATHAAVVLPGDSALNALWPKVSVEGVFHSTPDGARVSWTSWSDTLHRYSVGVTPTDSVRIPNGLVRLRAEKAGYRSLQYITMNALSRSVILDSVTAPDSDMQRVTGGDLGVDFAETVSAASVTLSDFRIDRHEVSNRQYKAFVEAGGYTRREYWDRPFVKHGKPVTWAAAMAQFTDKTGRPGPSTWEGGNTPQGQDDIALGGVSWYEAAAYARYVGKSLPTVYHWSRAAVIEFGAFIIPGSNFSGTGPSRGGTFAGMTPFGVFDMAGNVREWCENAMGDERYILGGGWSDPEYLFNNAYAQDPFDRSAINGIRLARYAPDERNLQLASRPIDRAVRDYTKERPVSDVVFESFRRMYDYDRVPLNAKIESRDTSNADWVAEKISLDAVYGHERLLAYLLIPKRATGRLQTIVVFPGADAIHIPSTNAIETGEEYSRNQDFLLSNGRAVMLPIYKSTFERSDSLKSPFADESVFYRDHVAMWAKDMRRAIDYLATRAEIDTSRLAYFGISWGGYLGGLLPAIEPRFKAVVLYPGGLQMERARPEVDPLNFLPRITVPVLMINGKNDNIFLMEKGQRPFYEHLGTPADRKRWVVYEGGHFAPRALMMKESLDWLDKYLGPVR